jgi:rsbT antagonist protein RsbS
VSERIPILRVGDYLLISVQTHLHDAVVERLQDEVLTELAVRPAKGVVVDVSSGSVLDTFTARALARTAQMAALMGARTITSGLSPSVALTLVEMGFNARGVETAMDVNDAFSQLMRPKVRKDARPR